jgi:prephenate dehydratase
MNMPITAKDRGSSFTRFDTRVFPVRLKRRVVAFMFGSASLVSAVTVQGELGFLGPRGTFSEQAAETYRRATPEVGASVPFETMTHVVEALRAGQISRGILPVASTVAGFPPESARLFLGERDPGFRVVSGLVLPIELHLLVKPGTSRDHVRSILSHPNALGESEAFLDEHFQGVAREETASTAAAAQQVSRGDGTLAAVASVAAGRLYGLEALDEAIQEDPHNATSFWVIARPKDITVPETAGQFVLLLDAPAGSRVLSDAVSSLRDVGLVVVFTNSVPLPGELYGFRYLIAFAAEQPVATQQITSAIESVSRSRGGSLLPLGWFD